MRPSSLHGHVRLERTKTPRAAKTEQGLLRWRDVQSTAHDGRARVGCDFWHFAVLEFPLYILPIVH